MTEEEGGREIDLPHGVGELPLGTNALGAHLETPRRFDEYTFKYSSTQILMHIKEQLLEARSLWKRPEWRNPNKYCLYHRDHGHDTECI